jgi:hypothetical protein
MPGLDDDKQWYYKELIILVFLLSLRVSIDIIVNFNKYRLFKE